MAIIEKIVWEYLWGMPLVVLCLFVGFYLTIKCSFFQFKYFPYVIKQLKDQFSSKENIGKGEISPFEAISIAIGSTVGVGNIGGVATAIAVGGPGAVFWLWIAGCLGQIIKMVEITLAVHYRSIKDDGTTFGGPTYYITKGIGKEKGFKKLYKILAFIFTFGFSVGFVITVQNYTVSEAVSSTFNMSMITISVIYTILLYIMIGGGLKSLGKIAAKIVPFMCGFYILGSLFIIFKNIGLLPNVISLIFKGAFTGTAAAGGFAGAAFTQVIKVGMSRSVFSNEAGWGSSPMIHASAKTTHPVKQGLLGIFEVFMDTIVICTLTAFIIIITGQWSTGATGADLTLSAFEIGIGSMGRIILAVGILLFGITTSSGIYAQIQVIVRFILGENHKYENKILNIYKWVYPLPGLALVVIAVIKGYPGNVVWLFADMSTAFPIFANLITLLILSPKFFELLKDYKARYMGIGEINPNIILFYEDKKQKTLDA